MVVILIDPTPGARFDLLAGMAVHGDLPRVGRVPDGRPAGGAEADGEAADPGEAKDLPTGTAVREGDRVNDSDTRDSAPSCGPTPKRTDAESGWPRPVTR
jgi:hypothetical protein